MNEKSFVHSNDHKTHQDVGHAEVLVLRAEQRRDVQEERVLATESDASENERTWETKINSH